MSPEFQSYAAITLFVLATGYLVGRWWRRRRSAQTGCASGGECACPTPKLKKRTEA